MVAVLRRRHSTVANDVRLTKIMFAGIDFISSLDRVPI